MNAAIGGSNDAWSALVQRFAPLVAVVAQRHRLSHSDSDDVAQTVWLRLVEHLADLREPRALPGWIVTTTRNEALRVVSARSRVDVVDPQADIRLHSVDNDERATNLLLAERRSAVRAGLANLQDPQRELLLLTRRPGELLPPDQPASRHPHRKHRTHPRSVSEETAGHRRPAGSRELTLGPAEQVWPHRPGSM